MRLLALLPSLRRVSSRALCLASRGMSTTVTLTGSATELEENMHPESEVLMSTTFGTQAFLDRWANSLRRHGIKVQTWPNEVGDLNKVEFAVVFDPPPGLLHQCPNLKAIQSMGAGVSPGMLEDHVCPSHVPLLRIVDPLTAQRMATFVLWSIVNCQRKCDAYLEAQRQQLWDKTIENYSNIDNEEFHVGLLGLGNIGNAVADLLLAAGYPVSAWTRTPRQKAGVRCFSGGRDQLRQFAAQASIVVCLVPLTPETRGLLDAEFFSWLPRGAYVINVSRGAHVVDEDLLAALDSGQLAGAVLDVHQREPLPQESPLWLHPRVRVFPHISSTPHVPFVAGQVVQNRRSILEGRPVPQERVVCRQRGY